MMVQSIGWPSALRSRLCRIGPSAALRADEQPSLLSGHPAEGGSEETNSLCVIGCRHIRQLFQYFSSDVLRQNIQAAKPA